jgi:hypothetical protein
MKNARNMMTSPRGARPPNPAAKASDRKAPR